jgi:hypothetical protein
MASSFVQSVSGQATLPATGFFRQAPRWSPIEPARVNESGADSPFFTRRQDYVSWPKAVEAIGLRE